MLVMRITVLVAVPLIVAYRVVRRLLALVSGARGGGSGAVGDGRESAGGTLPQPPG